MADLQSKMIIQNKTGMHAVVQAFDPNDKSLDNHILAELCPWYASPAAQFTVGYLKKRAVAVKTKVTQIHPDGFTSPWNCWFGKWGRKQDGYAGAVKLREGGREFSVRPHILFLLVRGYVPPVDFECHHVCNHGDKGCVGDPFEIGIPCHVIPVPSEVNAAAKCKRCWGLELPPCDGHIDKKGRKWPACPSLPVETSKVSVVEDTPAGYKRRLDEVEQDLVNLETKRITLLAEKKNLQNKLEDLENFK